MMYAEQVSKVHQDTAQQDDNRRDEEAVHAEMDGVLFEVLLGTLSSKLAGCKSLRLDPSQPGPAV